MTSTDMPSGNLLVAARHAAGLTQAELAHAAGIDPSTLSRTETAGTKRVCGKTENLVKILEALRAAGVELLVDGLRLVPRGKPLR